MGAKLTKTFQNKRLTNMIPIIAFGGTIMIIGIFTL